MRQVAAGVGEPLDAADVGLGHLAVALEREDERDVDRDAGGDRLLDRGQALQRRRDLDEQVRAVDERVQPLGLGDRRVGVVGEVGVDLERDPAVARVLAHIVPARAQDVAGRPDVVDGDGEEDLLRVALRLEHLAQLLVVGVALGDRALEDGRVGRHAVHALADERLELALLDEAAREKIDPDALPVGGELLQGSVGHEASSEGTGSQQTLPGPARRRTGDVSECARTARAARRRRPARRASPRVCGRRAPGSPSPCWRGDRRRPRCAARGGGNGQTGRTKDRCERGPSGGTLSHQGPDLQAPICFLYTPSKGWNFALDRRYRRRGIRCVSGRWSRG